MNTSQAVFPKCGQNDKNYVNYGRNQSKKVIYELWTQI